MVGTIKALLTVNATNLTTEDNSMAILIINDLDISTEMDQAALEAIMGGHRRHHKHRRHHGHGGHHNQGHGGHHRHGRHHRRGHNKTSLSLRSA